MIHREARTAIQESHTLPPSRLRSDSGAQTALQRLTRTSFKYTPGPSKAGQGSPEGLESAPLREVDILMERMRRADELCCIQTSFVHPLNFQESLVSATCIVPPLATASPSLCRFGV